MSWLTSRHAIRAAITRGAVGAVLHVTDQHARKSDLSALARTHGVDVRVVKGEWLRRNAGSSARGFALEIRSDHHDGNAGGTIVLADWLSRHDPETAGGPILALDHITDPQNVGAILRSAHLFGAALVIVPARRSVYAGEGISRSSAGAVSMVPLSIVSNLAGALRQCRERGWWIYAADTGGTPVTEARFPQSPVIVLGAEGKGVAPAVAREADVTVTIPDRAPPGTTIDSFNVSVAAGIILYEWFRTSSNRST